MNFAKHLFQNVSCGLLDKHPPLGYHLRNLRIKTTAVLPGDWWNPYMPQVDVCLLQRERGL